MAMKNVLIEYNPYKLKTKITVDWREPAENSGIKEKAADGSRLQDWVEEFPRLLIDEYNDHEFCILFHGTQLDYEDLTGVFTDAINRRELEAKIDHWPAKETEDKEKLIDEVFKEIQEGPFEELRDKRIINAFEQAKSSDFEVCVVAAMSAGKSTLINAMLRKRLMPSKQEACTAVITRIKDCSRDNVPFSAEVYDENNRLLETHQQLTHKEMKRLNGEEKVREIKVFGNIPFVTSEDVSLVLIDTPGPNNARDQRHREVQAELLGSSSKALVLYIMTGEHGTDDDNELLKRVAESMAVGGKQSKDRFIFVVNKLDECNTDDEYAEDYEDDINQILGNVRSYLKGHGIVNPNLFPASALYALNIRRMQRGVVNDTAKEKTEQIIRILNRNKDLHLETYATLPPSIRKKINERLEKTKAEWKGPDNENPEEALIHTGVVSLEAAISQYVRKYAKTAKIKNIVDTFTRKLEETDYIGKVKRELAASRDEKVRIVGQFESSYGRIKMDRERETENFIQAVDRAVRVFKNESRRLAGEIVRDFQTPLDLNGYLPVYDAEYKIARLINVAGNLESLLETTLYEVNYNKFPHTTAILFAALDKIKKTKYGGIWKKDEPQAWLREIGYFPTIFKTVNADGYELLQKRFRQTFKDVPFGIVSGEKFEREYFIPIKLNLLNNCERACQYAEEQLERTVKHLKEQFKPFSDGIELFAAAKERENRRISELERKLQWLERIKTKVESILEI
jgi:GTPase Era involved in 16S rRNA processing